MKIDGIEIKEYTPPPNQKYHHQNKNERLMIVWDDEKHAYIRKVAMINQDGSCYAFQPNGCKETLHLWKHCADIPEELKGNVSKLTSIKDDLGIRLLDPDEWVVPTVELFKDSFK